MRTGTGYRQKGRSIFSVKTNYTDEPMMDLKVVPYFLPCPGDLVQRDEDDALQAASEGKEYCA
jgi:hypothetical protein